MIELNNETEIIAVEKVLEEMNNVENYVKNWNACWWEQFLDAYSPSLSNYGMIDIHTIEEKYYNMYILENVKNLENKIGLPLKKAVLIDNYGEEHKCEFRRIDWYNMNSNKATRHFSFNNNGNIEFSKSTYHKQSIKNPNKIDYNASYNVLSNDFNISITLDELTEAYFRKKYKTDNFTLSLTGNILIESFNDIKIIHDLNTGIKQIKLSKKYDKKNKENNADVEFVATLNKNNELEKGNVMINTHKGNGKVNGTYKFDVSREKGISANFYSRKGVKSDLTKNILLLETASRLLLGQSEDRNNDNNITREFANSTRNVINKKKNEKVISFDNSDFNMEKVKQAEDEVIDMVKSIKGELPLPGLVDRINNCLKLIEKEKNEILDIEDHKALQLSKK